MAQFNKGILGGFSGKVGTVVGAKWRDKYVMRSLPAKSKRTATPAQAKQRAKFSMAAKFIAPLKPITDKYFGEFQGSKSRTNLAMSHQILSSIIESGNGKLTINYENVVIAKGVLPNVHVTEKIVADSKLTLNWIANANKNLAKDNDKLVVVAYSNEFHEFFIDTSTVERSAGTYTADVDETFTQENIEVWIFFVAADGSINSTSSYLRKE